MGPGRGSSGAGGRSGPRSGGLSEPAAAVLPAKVTARRSGHTERPCTPCRCGPLALGHPSRSFTMPLSFAFCLQDCGVSCSCSNPQVGLLAGDGSSRTALLRSDSCQTQVKSILCASLLKSHFPPFSFRCGVGELTHQFLLAHLNSELSILILGLKKKPCSLQPRSFCLPSLF